MLLYTSNKITNKTARQGRFAPHVQRLTRKRSRANLPSHDGKKLTTRAQIYAERAIKMSLITLYGTTTELIYCRELTATLTHISHNAEQLNYQSREIV